MGKKVKISQKAPDFEILDLNGNNFKLSDYRGKNHILLIFNRGFM
jgi:peroxiredoxin